MDIYREMDRWTKKIKICLNRQTGRDSNEHADSEEDRQILNDRQTDKLEVGW